MPTFKDVTVPADGQAITIHAGKLNVPDIPIIPFIEGDGTGPDIWRASVRVFDAAVAEGLRRASGRSRGWKSSPARRRSSKFNNWLPDDTVDGVPAVPRRHQGPADHAGRRRHPLAQRRAAADARPLRLPAPGAVFHRRALAGEASGEGGHGDLPREHGRHLRRHRIRRRHAGGAEGPRLPQQGIPQGVQEDPLRHEGSRRRLAEAARSDRRAEARGRRARSASASSRSATSAPSGWCTARSATRSSTSARA